MESGSVVYIQSEQLEAPQSAQIDGSKCNRRNWSHSVDLTNEQKLSGFTNEHKVMTLGVLIWSIGRGRILKPYGYFLVFTFFWGP